MISDFLNNLYIFWFLVKNTWWVFLPLVLFFILKRTYLGYLVTRYYKNLKWVLLEVRIPREVAKPPLAMEQIFAGLHSAYKGFDFYDKYINGTQQDHFSVEVAGIGGEIHFYFYTPSYYRNLIEAQVYSQYPESEIREVEDYFSFLPENLPNEEYEVFGAEFALSKEDAYPIRTYKEFSIEDISSKEEMRKVDPFSALAEALGKLRPGEYVGLQLLVKPAGDKWKKDGEALVSKLIGRKSASKKPFLSKIVEELHGAYNNVVGVESKPSKSGGDEKGTMMQHLSPGEKEVVAAIERNISKIGFDTVVRFIYVARRDIFDMASFSSMNAVLKQFNTLNLNGFKVNGAAATGARWWNPFKDKIKAKKRAIFWKFYRGRRIFKGVPSDMKHFVFGPMLDSKPFIFNVEELATIYHYPGITAGAPLMPRIQAKRSEPPIGLPTG